MSSFWDLEAGLARLGYDDFRPGQREAIETLRDVGRLLLVAPTGGGKSLCYQLPAILCEGTTLVISPLISLMADQVAALAERGVPATFLASTLGADEMRKRMRELKARAYDLVYVAPERLAFDGFRGLIQDLDPPIVAVDEAHCISEWGHDFRPDYLQIGELCATLPNARTLACTATATPIVRDEILARLGLDADTPQLVNGFARPNLALRSREAASRQDRDRAIDAALSECLAEPGAERGTAILYSITRKAAESEGARLARAGWRTGVYHAGLAARERERTQTAFQSGRLEVVVATNAFGMGIDRPDVRLVAHLGPPGSIEAYYQEVGRAGRDGADAVGLLLFSGGDLAVRRRLVEMPVDGNAPDPAVVEHKWSMFLELMRWAEGGSCRHDAILRYFGDEAETLDGCGRCDVCTALVSPDAELDAEAASTIVRKALSGIARCHGRFGLQLAVKLLRGMSDDRLEWSGLDSTTTYGVLKEHSDEWLMRLLRRLVVAGWIDFSGGNRPVVQLTEAGRAVMRGEREARLLLPSTAVPPRASARAPRRSGAGRASAAAVELDPAAVTRFEALRKRRLELAREGGVPPYVVASDRALRDIAALNPTDLVGLEAAHGIGPAKVERYGAEFLQVLRDTAIGG